MMMVKLYDVYEGKELLLSEEVSTIIHSYESEDEDVIQDLVDIAHDIPRMDGKVSMNDLREALDMYYFSKSISITGGRGV